MIASKLEFCLIPTVPHSPSAPPGFTKESQRQEIVRILPLKNSKEDLKRRKKLTDKFKPKGHCLSVDATKKSSLSLTGAAKNVKKGWKSVCATKGEGWLLSYQASTSTEKTPNNEHLEIGRASLSLDRSTKEDEDN
ncbi:hypothetical protein MJO28_002450 [Puccinia striiformis f. sp. tritici]|uniref:Uncharacterized protein n=1 Tax=Puccinia striiformis f. sp. tritici TaxID=168172 RepID=A0ACC0EQQ2_9BASI|nr:hypothetical protein MJO28_002450 [Puccinia striiformis f. sp. tritici]